MNTLEDQRAQLARKFTEVSAQRALYMERYGPILTDRNRRGELERKLRTHDKAVLAHAEARQKLCLVMQGLLKPAEEPKEITSDAQARVRGANAFHRRSLIEEEQRIYRRLGELQPEIAQVSDLQAQVAQLLPEDPALAKLVEDVQQSYNIVQEDLRRVEAAIAEGKEVAS